MPVDDAPEPEPRTCWILNTNQLFSGWRLSLSQLFRWRRPERRKSEASGSGERGSLLDPESAEDEWGDLGST